MQKYLCIFLLVSTFFVENSRSHSKPDPQEHEHVEYKNGDAVHSCEDCRSHNESKDADEEVQVIAQRTPFLHRVMDISTFIETLYPPFFKDADKEVQGITQLTRILHRAIEGNFDHVHIHSMRDFFQAFRNKEQWIRMLNFYQVARRTNIAFNLESQKHTLTNHLKNLAILFPISHFVEVLSAPAFVAVGTIHEFPSIVIGLGGSMLSVIAVPGLDPLCILLFASYPLKPVHRSIDFVRSNVEKGLRGVATTIRLNELFSRFSEHKDRLDFIKQQLESNGKLNRSVRVAFNSSPEGGVFSLFDAVNGNRILSLERIWDSEENRFYVRSLWVSQSAIHSPLKKFLKLLSWNARAAVKEVLNLTVHPQQIASYEQEFFVDEVTLTDEGLRVTYEDGAIYLRDKIQFRSGLRKDRKPPCEDSFL